MISAFSAASTATVEKAKVACVFLPLHLRKLRTPSRAWHYKEKAWDTSSQDATAELRPFYSRVLGKAGRFQTVLNLHSAIWGQVFGTSQAYLDLF